MGARRAAEQQQPVVFAHAEAASRLGPVVPCGVEDALVARVRHDDAAEAFLECDVRHGELVGRVDERLAGARPRPSERQRHVGIAAHLQDVVDVESVGFVEERELVVVDVEHERPVA